MPDVTGCAGAPTTSDPCPRCDLLLGLGLVHVEGVWRSADRVIVTVSTSWQRMGCPACGVVALSRGRAVRVLRDVPHGQTGVWLRWRQRRWRCPDPGCGVGTFTEQVPALVAARGSITVRAVTWAIGQLRREHATIAGLARQLGTSWKTLWRAIKPRLQDLADDQARFMGCSAWASMSTCGTTSMSASAARRS